MLKTDRIHSFSRSDEGSNLNHQADFIFESNKNFYSIKSNCDISSFEAKRSLQNENLLRSTCQLKDDRETFIPRNHQLG